MKAGSLIWRDGDGEGRVGEDVRKWLESVDRATALDAIRDWQTDLEGLYAEFHRKCYPGMYCTGTAQKPAETQ